MPALPFPLRHPILQAPTGSIAGPALCTAVTQAGGLGAMGLTWTAPDKARHQVEQVRAAVGADAWFQVNFVLHFPPHALDAALDAGAPIITFSWGDPLPYVTQVRDAGALLGVQVVSAAAARRAVEEIGADFLICQGIEAGGHVQASASLYETLPGVIAAAGGVPVVASGGIADGTGIVRALQAGASAAMLGTRFVATVESDAHPLYKQALLAAEDASETALTVCFEGGWTQAAHRVLRNATLNRWEASGCPRAGERPGEGEVVAYTSAGETILRYEDTAPRTGMTGSIPEMCLYAGVSVGAIHDLPTAAEAVYRLVSEGEAAVRGSSPDPEF